MARLAFAGTTESTVMACGCFLECRTQRKHIHVLIYLIARLVVVAWGYQENWFVVVSRNPELNKCTPFFRWISNEMYIVLFTICSGLWHVEPICAQLNFSQWQSCFFLKISGLHFAWQEERRNFKFEFYVLRCKLGRSSNQIYNYFHKKDTTSEQPDNHYSNEVPEQTPGKFLKSRTEHRSTEHSCCFGE